jgi:DNA-directed RNA polymerase subunit A'
MIGKKIKSIDFGLLSPEMVRKISAVRIITPDTYDDDGYPIEGGLMDLRLGVIDPGLRCKTCGGRIIACSGHFGHIELIRPVIHAGYVKMILILIKTTCRKCGRILLDKDKIERYKALMLKEEREEEEEKTIEILEKTKKAKKCPHCGQKQENIKLLKPTTFFEGEQRLLPSQIRERLERIPDKDVEMLGINTKVARSEWAVLTVLPVPPATTRPSITLETGERSEDDLTHKLVDVLRINQRLADNISAGAPQLIIEDLWDLLQYHVTTYFNNEVSGIPPARHRSGRALRTLFQRLKGKEGRFRYYLSGKRVNFSARTVISPDPNISISEVGVPIEIAKELTIPLYVTEWNLEEMKSLLKKTEYPCINYVIRPDGKRKKVMDVNREEVTNELAPGYILERQLTDGDIVIFNRQPSLHRVSMMAHYVKILPGKTFRLNDAVSDPYNADFDGDEMNLHVLQTQEAMLEAEALAKVENHILLIKNGEPIICGHADHISGTFLLTAGAKFSKEKALWLLGQIGINDLPQEKDGAYLGVDIFNLLIPKDISFICISKLCRLCGTCDFEKCPYNAFIIVENGKLKSGALEAKGFKLLVKKIYETHGPQAAREFIDKATKLALATLMCAGFTSSFEDAQISDKAKNEIDQEIGEAFKKIDAFIEKYKKGELERMPGKTTEETLEDLIMAELRKTRDICGRYAERSLGQNSHITMARSGARGSMLHVTQMSACLGQSAVRGKRMIRGYRQRPLPYLEKADISAQARGFIKNCFRDGLSPIEYIFHSMSGRDSLVDKGINTARSGYMQRRLINALIDINVHGDTTVRESNGQIIQFLYGEDNVNPTYCVKEKGINVEGYLQKLEEFKKLNSSELFKKLGV